MGFIYEMTHAQLHGLTGSVIPVRSDSSGIIFYGELLFEKAPGDVVNCFYLKVGDGGRFGPLHPDDQIL